MFKVLFLTLIFLIPFQVRYYKWLKPLSLSWIDPTWQIPSYFEPYADFYITDFLLLALGLWALFQRKIDLKEQKYLTLFLAAALLSIISGSYGTYLLSYWRWAHWIVGAVLVYALASWTFSFKTMAQVVVVSAILECVVALGQYGAQHHLGLKFIGEPTVVSKHVVSPHFIMPKKAVTSIDYLLKEPQEASMEASMIYRATGTLPHPNVLGGFLVFSLLMTCYLFEISERRKWISAALIVQLITLFTTYSRSALFAFAGAIVLWLLLHLLQEKRLSKVWIPVLSGIAVSILLFYPQLFHRGGMINYNSVAATSDERRVEMQNIAALIIRDHPWLGVGFNNYLLAFDKYTKVGVVDSISVHNIYLLIAAETGLIGIAFFLLFCAFIVYKGWQERVSPEGRTLLVLFLAFLAIGMVDYYPILFQQARLIFFLTAGLITGGSYLNFRSVNFLWRHLPNR